MNFALPEYNRQAWLAAFRPNGAAPRFCAKQRHLVPSTLVPSVLSALNPEPERQAAALAAS